MTTPTREMTDEELRVRLAELAGTAKQGPVWDNHRYAPNSEGKCFLRAVLVASLSSLRRERGHVFPTETVSPNYPKDANAVAEVRKGLTKMQRFKFGVTVSKLIAGNDHQCPPFDLIDASPRIQTIALILTLTP
jgi:hypothetical protein